MNDNLLTLGVNHKTAPVALRERLALPAGRSAAVLNELVAHEAIQEAVAISTCNRTEIYLVAADQVAAESEALAILSRQADIRPTELFGRLYSLRGEEAVRHLFEVAAGLDSMIVGEAEVQGQVKRAYEVALAEGATGPVANRLFRDALAAGKRVRTETALGRTRSSVSSVAVELAQATLGALETKRVLVIGAGENGELTAEALHRAGVHTVFVANRRYDRAIGLAQRFGGQAVRFDDLPTELLDADIVVSCTASPHQIVGRDELSVVMEQRPGKPLLLIDIAVPRDIEPAVRDIQGITLYDMDDLQRAVDRKLSVQEAEARKARALIDQDVEGFERWLASLDVLPTIAALRERADSIVEQVLHENERRWENLGEADRERVEVLARAVVQRLLHEPTLRLKRSVGDEDAYVYVQALHELFGLEGGLPSAEGQGAQVTSLEERRRRQR